MISNVMHTVAVFLFGGNLILLLIWVALALSGLNTTPEPKSFYDTTPWVWVGVHFLLAITIYGVFFLG